MKLEPMKPQPPVTRMFTQRLKLKSETENGIDVDARLRRRPGASCAARRDGIFALASSDPDGLRVSGIHRAIRARGFRGEMHELVFTLEEREFLVRNTARLDQVDDLRAW